MAIPRYVVDASVVLKWLLPVEQEQHWSQACQVQEALIAGDIAIMLPALWRFEVGNTLCRLVPVQAQALLVFCMELGMQDLQNDDWMLEAVRLATTYPVTFYDASYHAVAKTVGGLLVTADQRYIDKVLPEGNVMHIKDWCG